VKSSRGFQGGYQLTKPLEEYVIGDVLRLTEGSLAPVECLSTEEKSVSEAASVRDDSPVGKMVDEAIRSVVDHVTLKDLVDWQAQEKTKIRT